MKVKYPKKRREHSRHPMYTTPKLLGEAHMMMCPEASDEVERQRTKYVDDMIFRMRPDEASPDNLRQWRAEAPIYLTDELVGVMPLRELLRALDLLTPHTELAREQRRRRVFLAAWFTVVSVYDLDEDLTYEPHYRNDVENKLYRMCLIWLRDARSSIMEGGDVSGLYILAADIEKACSALATLQRLVDGTENTLFWDTHLGILCACIRCLRLLIKGFSEKEAASLVANLEKLPEVGSPSDAFYETLVCFIQDREAQHWDGLTYDEEKGNDVDVDVQDERKRKVCNEIFLYLRELGLKNHNYKAFYDEAKGAFAFEFSMSPNGGVGELHDIYLMLMKRYDGELSNISLDLSIGRKDARLMVIFGDVGHDFPAQWSKLEGTRGALLACGNVTAFVYHVKNKDGSTFFESGAVDRFGKTTSRTDATGPSK